MQGLSAQVQVTSITYNTLANSGDQTNQKIKSLNEFRSASIIDTTDGNYLFSAASAGATVNFRRSSATNNNATAFYQYSTYSGSSTAGTAANVFAKGDKSPTLNEVMLSNDLSQGLRNPFANLQDGVATSLTSNIERIDFNLGSFTITNAADGLVFFDLENFGNAGDGFRIAAFTATGTVNVNGTNHTNAPTTYANTGLLVAPGSFGTNVAVPNGTDAQYLRSTTTSGDNLDVSQTIAQIDSSNDGTIDDFDLVLVGVLVRFSDLGLSVGDTILGYSLIASDTVVGAAADLVNWGNSSVYLTNTDSNTTAGDMDFMGFGAQISRRVPEPSTYGLILSGGATLLALWRRSRRRNASQLSGESS